MRKCWLLIRLPESWPKMMSALLGFLPKTNPSCLNLKEDAEVILRARSAPAREPCPSRSPLSSMMMVSCSSMLVIESVIDSRVFRKRTCCGRISAACSTIRIAVGVAGCRMARTSAISPSFRPELFRPTRRGSSTCWVAGCVNWELSSAMLIVQRISIAGSIRRS